MQANSEALLNLETRFWQSMVDKDPAGTMQITPGKYGEMTQEGQWRLDKFEFTDVSVVHPNPETAVIAYKVHQTGTMKNEEMNLYCADSSTWVRDGHAWKCVLHTETVMGNPH